MSYRSIFAAIALAASASGALAQQAADGSATVDAFSVWSAAGVVIATGPRSHAFAGEMSGPYFVDAGEGPVPAGRIVCVGALEGDEATGRQSGAATCQLRAIDGAVAYGGFSCEGWRLVGCTGRFEITGGEGRMAGVTGEGSITLRRYETSLAELSSGEAEETGLGIAYWRGFTLHPAASPE
ncbi:hypothetical protein SAMN05444336_10116 [Albimonas donghaensis]|uniref:Uncharacterized protein n=1 Tax=Albimonas donghaensis TaxID=356660 RepID=A0A1H2QD35_9RHOB|nr:hypothetical protein [Albimonas donghaensis]SDW04995.1 hypothetical protein SAMN05444336_10116 [Albimonas donghaensis]